MIVSNQKCTEVDRKKGFTLIEIVSVLVILGILVAIAATKYFDLKDDAEKRAAQSVLAEAQSRINSRFGELLLQGDTCSVAVSKVNKKEFLSDLEGDYSVTWDGELNSDSPTLVVVSNKKSNQIILNTETLLAPQCATEGGQAGGGSEDQGGSGSGGNTDPSNPGGDANWKDRLQYPPIAYKDINHPGDALGVLYEKEGEIYVTNWDLTGIVDWSKNPKVIGFTESKYVDGNWNGTIPQKGEIYQDGNTYYVCKSETGCSRPPESSWVGSLLDSWIKVEDPSKKNP